LPVGAYRLARTGRSKSNLKARQTRKGWWPRRRGAVPPL